MNNAIEQETSVSELAFHQGNTLWKLANTYTSLPHTINECIQNAIDGMGQRIFVSIDYKNRRVVVADDGEGVSKLQFERALASVGQSIKTADRLGRFGLGLISPLNKCKSFSFVSAHVSERRSGKWVFNAQEIKNQSGGIKVPYERVQGLPVLAASLRQYAAGPFNVAYRTKVTMNDVVADKTISMIDLDEFESDMLTKLGVRMRERAVQVRVVVIDSQGCVTQRDISATDYAGEKLPPVLLVDKDAGRIEIQLYRAQKLAGKRHGLVTVAEMDNPAAVTIKNVARQCRSGKLGDLTEPMLQALSSRYFEGVIKCSGITLHPERTKFEYNDAFTALMIALAIWYSDHGQKLYENEQETSQEKRYQELGLKSQEKIRDILNEPGHQHLLAGLETIQYGRMGLGHSTPAKGRPNGMEEIGSTRVGQGGAGKPRTSGPKPQPPRSASEPGRDRPGDTPFGVLSSIGQTRRLVKGDSQGLWYEYSVLSGSSHLWEFDYSMGVLTFNIRHPLWLKLDETKGKHLPRNAKWILQLQEWVTMGVLHLLAECPGDPALFSERRAFIDVQTKFYIDAFIMNPR